MQKAHGDVTYVALPANHLIAVVLGGKGLQRWLDDATTETEDQVKRGLLCNRIQSVINLFEIPQLPLPLRCLGRHSVQQHDILGLTLFRSECSMAPYLLDVVVAQRPAILKLLAGEDQTLLVWRDTLLVLDLALDIVDRVAGLDLEGDGLAREGFDEAGCRSCQRRGSLSSDRFTRGLHLHWR